jgi:arylamine N-acetyltransferase
MRTDHLSSYLRRLELDAPEPTVEALFALHRAQVERIPYETTWIHLGETWNVDPGADARRILDQRPRSARRYAARMTRPMAIGTRIDARISRAMA